MAKRKRRAFTKEFKAQAARIVRERGESEAAVARELDLTETARRSWVRQGEIDADPNFAPMYAQRSRTVKTDR